MATIEHSTLTTTELHEPKGADSASDGQMYIADGAGSGDWRYMPHGFCKYSNIGTGTTITAPTTYTLVNPTTTADSNPREVTHNSAGRLTYTGANTMDFNLWASITLKHSSASIVDVFFEFYKNGVACGCEHATAALSGTYTHITLLSHIELTTNDYIEVYTKTASGNVIVHAIGFELLGKL